MRFSEGTAGSKVLFAALVGVYALGLTISVHDKLQRVGQPDVGWIFDRGYISPSRYDAANAGLWGGGRAIRVNGIQVEDRLYLSVAGLRTGIGDMNTITLQRPSGEMRDVTIRVRAWEWHDVVFTEGATGVLGLLFFVVGIATFLLRPYEIASWALLTVCTVTGSILTTQFVPIRSGSVLTESYVMTLVGLVSYLPYHTGLAFPVVHPVLTRWPRILLLIYGLGVCQAALYLGTMYTGATALHPYVRTLGAGALLVSILFFVGRCTELALRARDRLVAQRARILLAGTVFGLVPVAVVQFMQETFNALNMDNRLVYWTLSIFLLALGHITVRPQLLNARIAVRRAVFYGAAVGVLTALAVLLIALRTYAVAILLLPLLYWWPRFDAWLNARLYPKRGHFPELLREIGGEMATCASVEDVLRVLAEAPARLCDARGGVAFLLPGAAGSHGYAHGTGEAQAPDASALGDEVLVRLMGATRKEILRSQLAVQPSYSKIRNESYGFFDRLGAEVLLPVLREDRVIGGLAIGPRASGDLYEAAELDALSTVAAQAVQAITRVEATERLRQRELEFAELKRFFPPQIIDQVMAKGGAAELRSQRKLVTVFFADLRGFTSFSDRVEPEEVMSTLANYHAAMGHRIGEFSGTLERFVGDGFMVFFNDPVDQDDHVERAIRMALAMRTDIERLRAEWSRRGYQIDVGMGIDTGYATCGFIGYEGRRDYGVIGNVTNLAARLSDAAGGGEILVSARVHAELRNGQRAERLGELALKGFSQPQLAYRLL